MSQKRKRTPEPPPDASGELYISEAIEDRTSKFIGYFSPTLHPKDLQQHATFKSASHKILAWRKEGKQRSLTGSVAQYDTGHDDDGEKFGGKTVEKVLVSMKVTGACVVARWYGGVMLGPVRFQHMEECAKGAVLRWLEHEAEERRAKRQKAEDAVEQGKLARSLGERDRSIEVLRALAVEKETKVKDVLVAGMADLDEEDKPADVADKVTQESSPLASSAASPKKPAIDYSSMPVDRLRALDKARDATLSFLLKRISKVEADLAALGEPGKPP